jgi:hypothetical protein
MSPGAPEQHGDSDSTSWATVRAVGDLRTANQQSCLKHADGEVEAEAQEFRAIFSRAGAELIEGIRIQMRSLLPEKPCRHLTNSVRLGDLFAHT